MKTKKQVCLLVSNWLWHQEMAERLTAKTNLHFNFIHDSSELTNKKLSLLNPRYIFFPFWSQKITNEIYSKYECIIFHMTDLPFGRGGSPLQNLISRKIYETKISAIKCVEEMDAGPIYTKRSLNLYGSASEIYIRASDVIENMILDIINTKPIPEPQKGKPTIFRRRKPEQSNLISAKSLDDIFDTIRMLDADGYPKAFLEIGEFKLEFSRANHKFGEILADVSITKVSSSGSKDDQ